MKKATYEQIAKKTGLSIATISRCFKQTGKVKPDTKTLIFAAANSLGMDTSMYEKGEEKSDIILFNCPSLDNPFYSTIIKGARSEAVRHGYDLLVNESHIRDNSIEDVLKLIKNSRAAGIITTNHIERPLVERIGSLIPLVQCCECIEDSDYPFVTVDDAAASKRATEYLISQGRRKIAFINGPKNYKYAEKREKGYLAALAEAGIEINPRIMVHLDAVNFEMAVTMARQMLNSEEKPDAFFTISDVYAAAVLKAVIKAGLRVPEDISVVGFDNIEFSSLFTPAITTINMPRFQLGVMSADLLFREIAGVPCINSKVYLDTELIVRESTEQKGRN